MVPIYASNAPTTSPNLKGTLAGVAATLAVGLLSNAGYLSIIAASTGLPEASIGILAMAIVGGIVNYGVTHIAAVKKLNDLYDNLSGLLKVCAQDAQPFLHGFGVE